MATPSTQNNTDATIDTLATMLRTASETCRTTADAVAAGTHGTGGVLDTTQLVDIRDAAERLVAVIAHSAAISAATELTNLGAASATRLTNLGTRRTAKANELASADESDTFEGDVGTADETL